MRISFRQLAVTAAFLAGLSCFSSEGYAESFRPTTDRRGKPPRTVLVEQPQEALKVWQTGKQNNKTLLIISSGLGLARLGTTNDDLVIELARKGEWDRLLVRDYPTPRQYAVSGGNFVYLACRLGMVDRVYWVAATRKSVGEEPFDSFKDFLKGLGVAGDDLENIKQTKDSIQGSINGVPVYICSLADLPRIKEEVLMLVDLTFFMPFYDNEVKTPFLDIFGWFMSTLGSKDVKVSDAVISYSTAGGEVPLEHRFLGGYIRESLTKPGKLSKGPKRTWLLRAQAMYNDTFYQTEESLNFYKKAVKLDPDDASLRYGLSAAYFTLKELDPMKDELDAAVKRDRGYYPAYIDYAEYFAKQEMPNVAEVLYKDALKINPSELRALDGLEKLYFSHEKYWLAAEMMEKITELGFAGPGSQLHLADIYQKLGLYDKSIKAYEGSLAMVPVMERDARAEVLMGLAGAYEGDRKVEKALSTLQEAMDLTTNPHLKEKLSARIEELRSKWAPFLDTTHQTAP